MKIKNIRSVGQLPVYDLSIATNEYDEQQYVLENGVVSHIQEFIIPPIIFGLLVVSRIKTVRELKVITSLSVLRNPDMLKRNQKSQSV